MARILAVAENFAFGPVSKLLTVANRLMEKGHELYFAGTGTAYQMAQRSTTTEIFEVDTDAPDYAERIAPWLDRVDLVLSCMDRSTVLVAQQAKRPVVWLDILFWWWDELPDFVLEADLFIVQNTLDSTANAQRYDDRIRSMVTVGPILDVSVRSDTHDNQLMVVFGGMEAAGWYAVGSESTYPFTIVRMLRDHVDLSGFSKVLVAGNARVTPELAERFGDTGWEFACLGRQEYLRELGRSAAMLAVPGLETPLEAWAYGVPTVFLPPSNSSQYVQLDDFLNEGVADASVHFRRFLPGLDLAGRPLREIMGEFLGQLRLYEQNDHWCAETGRLVSGMLADRAAWPALVAAGHRYIASRGGLGLEATVDAIEAMLPQERLR